MIQLKERPQVLIADDEEPIRKLLCTMMQDLGFEPLEAPTGEVALEMLNHNSFDLLMLDIALPGIDGMQVLREAKIRDRDLPIVMIAGHGSIPIAVKAIKNGAENFLTKPFQREDLIATLTKPLRRRLDWRAKLLENEATDASKAFDGLKFSPCCYCSFEVARRSQFRGFELLFLLLWMRPYRCVGCDRRFWDIPVKRWFDNSKRGLIYWIYHHRWGKKTS